MTRMRNDVWNRLVALYEAADAEAHAAYLACDDAESGEAQREADERHDALRGIVAAYLRLRIVSLTATGRACAMGSKRAGTPPFCTARDRAWGPSSDRSQAPLVESPHTP